MKSNEYRYLSLCDGYLEGNELWFSNNNLNALCRENLDSMEIEIIATFHRREKWKKTLHRKIIGYKNFFYLIPNDGNEIDVFDRNTGEQTYIEIPKIYLHNDNYCVSNAFIINDCIWIFPIYAYQSVIIYSICKKKFFEVSTITRKLKDYGGTIFSYKSIYLDKECFWMTILQSNSVICYNWKTKNIKEYKLDIDNLYSIHKFNSEIWIGTWDAENILVWDYERNNFEKIKLDSEKVCLNSFFNPIVVKNKAYILSKSPNNRIGNKKKIVPIILDKEISSSEGLPSMFECIYKNKLFVFPYKMKYMVQFDLLEENIVSMEFRIPDSYVLNNYYEEYKIPFLRDESKRNMIYEIGGLGLEELIEIYEMRSEISKNHNYSNSGVEILNYINGALLR